MIDMREEKSREDTSGEFSRLINKSLGLAQNVDRSTLDEALLEQIARRENHVLVLESRGKSPLEIKRFIKEKFF